MSGCTGATRRHATIRRVISVGEDVALEWFLKTDETSTWPYLAFFSHCACMFNFFLQLWLQPPSTLYIKDIWRITNEVALLALSQSVSTWWAEGCQISHQPLLMLWHKLYQTILRWSKQLFCCLKAPCLLDQKDALVSMPTAQRYTELEVFRKHLPEDKDLEWKHHVSVVPLLQI